MRSTVSDCRTMATWTIIHRLYTRNILYQIYASIILCQPFPDIMQHVDRFVGIFDTYIRLEPVSVGGWTQIILAPVSVRDYATVLCVFCAMHASRAAHFRAFIRVRFCALPSMFHMCTSILALFHLCTLALLARSHAVRSSGMAAPPR
jgi:hypothetical protein